MEENEGWAWWTQRRVKTNSKRKIRRRRTEGKRKEGTSSSRKSCPEKGTLHQQFRWTKKEEEGESIGNEGLVE